jgi:hypothetical protein
MGGKLIRHLVVAASALALGACASTYALTPSATAAQQVSYDHGTAVVMSKMENGAVRVAPTSTAFEGRLSLGVVAFNDGKTPQNLGVENVKVFTAAGVPVRVYSYEQLVKQAKNAAMWQAIAVGLAAGANAYSASQPTTVQTNGSIYGSGGYAHYASNTTVYNPTNAALANAVNDANTQRSMSQIGATLDATLAGLGNSVLRTTTIVPGEAFGGNIIADKPRFAKGDEPALRVLVTFAGEEHEFRFAVAPS